VGWFYTHETTAFGLKVERHLHKRKKAAHQTPHTHKREIETTVHTEEERRKREKERKKERKKVAWEAVLQGKDKSALF
jgi:hypothetical protein